MARKTDRKPDSETISGDSNVLTNEEILEWLADIETRIDTIPKLNPLYTTTGKPKYQVLDEDDGYHD